MNAICLKSSIFAALLFPAVTGIMIVPLQAQPAMLGLRASEPQLESPTGALSESAAEPQAAASPGTESQVGPTPPSLLVLPAGTIITIEALEVLSSDTQHAGDSFVAELRQPLVVDGWVVARIGQTVMGRIAEAKKAGRVRGTSKLSLELQQIVLVDGHQAPVVSDLLENSGPTSQGRDLAAVAITTGVGAAVGAVCGGKGAAIGAAAGATAGIAGILLTRGEKTEIEPEKPLTFRLSSPLMVSTEQSRHSFWQVEPEDYDVSDRNSRTSSASTVPVVVARPAPRPVPLTVWPETQGIVLGRPGRRECGS